VRFEFQLKWFGGGCGSVFPGIWKRRLAPKDFKCLAPKKIYISKWYHQREIAEIGAQAQAQANDAAQRPKVKAKTRTHLDIKILYGIQEIYILLTFT